ncbi:MFS transporter [Neotabrizicola sp. VNH66]|uniref:MFS transporter n=1 Tax=Neotabrizicola sp. VNH66 TaxID=3400918 RepID=UPI003BFF133D
MSGIFTERAFRILFGAQTLGLLGNGVTIVGLSYFAYSVAGDRAGAVIGLFYITKMLAFITIAPLSSGIRIDRKSALIGLCLFRAAVVLLLPLSDSVWQAVLVVLLIHSATAAFVPLMQTVLSQIFPDEARFTRAVGMTRLSYSMEQVASPIIVGALLFMVAPPNLFFVTAVGFVLAALVLTRIRLPQVPATAQQRAGLRGALRGIRIYSRTPRLRALVAADLAVACAAATVFLNTVVIVQGRFGLPEHFTAIAYGAFGCGAAASSLLTPRLLDRISDRSAILAAGTSMAVLTILQYLLPGFAALLPVWFLMGAGYSLALIPAARVVRRSSAPEALHHLFAAQVMQTHCCWLVAYLVVGFSSAAFGADASAPALGLFSLLCLAATAALWPARDPEELAHSHDDLPADHPHLREGIVIGGTRHSHRFVIDDLHRRWPAPHP